MLSCPQNSSSSSILAYSCQLVMFDIFGPYVNLIQLALHNLHRNSREFSLPGDGGLPSVRFAWRCSAWRFARIGTHLVVCCGLRWLSTSAAMPIVARAADSSSMPSISRISRISLWKHYMFASCFAGANIIHDGILIALIVGCFQFVSNLFSLFQSCEVTRHLEDLGMGPWSVRGYLG